MKKHLALIFVSLCFLISTNSFAQIDSSKLADTQRQVDKDRRKADKLQKKAEKKENKMNRKERRMERKEKKRERKLEKVEKGERKLNEIRKDSTGTGFFPHNRQTDTLYERRYAKYTVL